MRHVTYLKGGWRITVHADRAPKAGKNVMHGNATLLATLPGIISLSQGRGQFHGLRCDMCAAYPCAKTPTPEQEYCAWFPPRFQASASGGAR